MSNEELIAEARAAVERNNGLNWQGIVRRLADALEAQRVEIAALTVEADRAIDQANNLAGDLAVLRAQSAPLVADSREALARQMYRIREGVRFISSHDSNRSPEVDRTESDKAYWSWDNGKAGRAMYDTYRDLARDVFTSGVVSLAADRDAIVAVLERFEVHTEADDDSVYRGQIADAIVAYRESEVCND